MQERVPLREQKEEGIDLSGKRWWRGVVVFVLVILVLLTLKLFLKQPLSLDEALQTPIWGLPYAFRLPGLWALLATVLINWWAGEREWLHAKHSALLKSIPLPVALQPSPSMIAVRKRFGSVIEHISGSRVLFLLLVGVTLFAFRWQMLRGYEQNVDESQSIVAARMVLNDPRFWVSADVGTHGPLVSLWQTLLPLFGLAVDYAGSRLLCLVMVFAYLGSLYTLLRRISPDHIARLVLLPVAFLFSSLSYQDFTAYNGEHPLIFMGGVCVGLASAALLPVFSERGDKVSGGKESPEMAFRPSLPLLALSGLFLGGICWAKQQGIPIVAVLFVAIAIGCWTTAEAGKDRLRVFGKRFGVFLLGFLTPTLAILLWAASNHALVLMYRSYFEWNAVYAARNKGEGISTVVIRMVAYIGKYWPESTPFASAVPLVPIYTALALVFFAFWNRRMWRGVGMIVAAIATSLVCAVCVILPGNPYTHYFLFLFFALGGLNTILWTFLMLTSGETKENSEGRGEWKAFLRPTLGVIFIVTSILLPTGAWMKVTFNTLLPTDFSLAVPQGPMNGEDQEIVPLLQLGVPPGERMMIWGWRPRWFVLSDRLSAARSSITFRETLYDLPMQPYFFQLSMTDMDKYNPAVFVDAVTNYDLLPATYNWMTLRIPTLPKRTVADFQHEKYPELNRRIEDRYRLFYMSGGGVRIYFRKDRYDYIRAHQDLIPGLKGK